MPPSANAQARAGSQRRQRPEAGKGIVVAVMMGGAGTVQKEKAGRWPARRAQALACSSARDHWNGGEYSRPPLFHCAFRPRSSFSGVAAPRLRSQTSP
ncbi:hypothetical protein D3C85_903660 [compost metagenome]